MFTRSRVKSWEIIADNLSKAGWSWGCVSAVDSEGRTIWIADAHCDDGKRFIVRTHEKLTARRASRFVSLSVACRSRAAEIQPVIVCNLAPAFATLMQCYDFIEAPARFISQQVCFLGAS